MDPTKDAFGLSIEAPPDVSSALEDIQDENVRDLIEQRLAFHAEREQELYAIVERQDVARGKAYIDADIKHQDVMGSLALQGNTPNSQGDFVAINPEIHGMVFNIHLLVATMILSRTDASEERLQMAHNSAQKAYWYAMKSQSKTLAARSHFYTGMVAFRRGSLREAMKHFRDALDADQLSAERRWAQQWLSACEGVVKLRGDASLGNTPIGSPMSAQSGTGIASS